jgi:hypothetical protein
MGTGESAGGGISVVWAPPKQLHPNANMPMSITGNMVAFIFPLGINSLNLSENQGTTSLAVPWHPAARRSLEHQL